LSKFRQAQRENKNYPERTTITVSLYVCIYICIYMYVNVYVFAYMYRSICPYSICAHINTCMWKTIKHCFLISFFHFNGSMLLHLKDVASSAIKEQCHFCLSYFPLQFPGIRLMFISPLNHLAASCWESWDGSKVL
jgi:hypothetical protein